MDQLANREGAPHPRTLGWLGTTALAMGGSNQSLFLLAALFAGIEGAPGQGSAAVPLLIAGLLLSYAAIPGWLELVLMSPSRVGGIAAVCGEAFRPYSQILSALAGVCYWWGWIPTCGLTAIFSATAIHQWYWPSIPVPLLATLLVTAFTVVNLCGIKWVTRLAVPIATVSAVLAFVSSLAPIFAGHVDWHQALHFQLTTPFPGWFGGLTSTMAGLYLIGFAAPAFEAAACHVGETVDPVKNVPKAMWASAAMAAIYFVVLPVVWLGTLGSGPLGSDQLGMVLGPTFAPLLGSAAKAAAIWFITFNMFHGTIQPLAGAARTLSQLSDDGLAPRLLGRRSTNDVPWVATLTTAAFSIAFLLLGDPIWLVAAANFTYLISIGLPSIAVWLLRRDAPDAHRPYRAPRGTIGLGVAAAACWGLSTILGFQQFGLPTVVCGLLFAYSGAGVFAWRKLEDRRRIGLRGLGHTLHLKLTGAMLLVLALDGAGYILAVSQLPETHDAMKTALEDIFVAVAILTISVGIVLPGMIAHSAEELSKAAHRLATGTLKDFSNAMSSLGRGDLDAAHATFTLEPLRSQSRDELGIMVESFNALQVEIGIAAVGLDGAREGLRHARNELTDANRDLRRARDELEEKVRERTQQLQAANSAKSAFLANMSHELRTPLNAILGYAQFLKRDRTLGERQIAVSHIIQQSGEHLLMLITDILDLSKIEAGKLELNPSVVNLPASLLSMIEIIRIRTEEKALSCILDLPPELPRFVWVDERRLRQVLLNLLGNAVKFTESGQVGLHVSSVSVEDTHVRLTFGVQDTGIGIERGMHESIFQPFEQAGHVRERAGGTGLGLSISRHLVRLMGGDIEVESRPGEGSRFSFELTLPVMDTPPPDNFPSERITGYRGRRRHILVVDDAMANRELLVDTLSGLGFDLREATNGLEAIERARMAPPDLIMMDVRMPVMDGLEAMRRLQDIEALRAIPIIAISAGVTEEEQMASLTAGAVAFLSKPIEHESLLREIGGHLQLDWILETPRSAEPKAIESPLHATPPREEIEVLHGLAMTGDMRAVSAWAAKLAARDEKYLPFADRLQQMARGFQSEAIVGLAEKHINQELGNET